MAEFLDAESLGTLRRGACVTYRPELAADRPALLAALRALRPAALLVRNRCRVDAEALSAAPDLRVVGRLGVGLDNVDLAACRAGGVRVVFARGANATAVAEYVFAALLHLLRGLPAADAAVRAGRWPRDTYAGEELAGRTIGVVGLGEVGRRVCRRAAAFEMRVLGCDPLLPPGDPRLQGLPVEVVGLEALLPQADVLTLHLPLEPATHHLIGPAALARLRPGAVLINTARGGVVDEEALRQSLAAGHLAGAALDVREAEPPPQPDPLAGLPGVLLTPHVAGLTLQAQARVGAMVVADVLAVLDGRDPRTAVV